MYAKTILLLVIISLLNLSRPSSVIGQIVNDTLLLQHIDSIDAQKEKDISQLTAYLIHPYQTDQEKFRSIYLWLIHHIEYDQEAVENKRINQNNQDILDRGKAICWGYATLLKSMCEQADIPVIVVSGYSRSSLKEAPFLSYPNHAWNAVQLDNTWYLVDATWDSSLLDFTSLFYQKFQQDYYLTNPAYFITNHLPANPQLQLLDCPISLDHFELPIDSIVQIAQQKDCTPAQSKLSHYANLNYFDQQLLNIIEVYQFNPTDENRRELAHTQIEYQEYLSEKAERLQAEQKFDSLLQLQLQMIDLCEVSSSLTQLYDTQLENCAYNYFNHAVALSQVTLTTENEEQHLRKMLYYFEKANKQLSQLPKNIFIEQAVQQSVDYMAYLKERLGND